MKNGEILPGPPLGELDVFALDDVEPADAAGDVDADFFEVRLLRLPAAPCFTAKSAPARAIWMKRPIFFNSFFSIQWSGSKFFISPAMVQSKPVVSKCVIGPTPLSPATRFFQTFLRADAQCADQSNTRDHNPASST